MSLVDEVQTLENYLTKQISNGNKYFTATDNRQKAQPDGQLTQQLQTQTSTSAMNSIAGNPLVNTISDTVNQSITSVAQQVVSTAITKVNLTPIQNASQQFFTLFASVTSFGIEVAMQFARNTGNNLIAALAQKDATSDSLEAEIVALYNACAIMLNGQPFFNQYLQNILAAYQLIVKADTNLQNVVIALQAPTPIYQKITFTLAQSQLTQAQNLILPNRGVDVSSIRSTANFVSTVIKRQSNQQVYAAALSIPGITVQIGKLAMTYELQSVNVNAYLNTYLNALSNYITGYMQSNAVNQATIDHLSAGISQINSLLAQMNTTLSQYNGQPTAAFAAQLSMQGTQWGVELAAIIAWLGLNPGAGSALLTQTSLSVTAYTKSINTINGLGDITFNGGTVYITNGEENPVQGLILPLARFLLAANTLLATSTSKTNIYQQATVVRTYLQKARVNDAEIKAAVQPFLNTKTTLTGPVAAGISTLLAFSNKMGLDRLAGLITNGNVKDLFSSTPATSTYAGAAVTAINSIVMTIQASPNATTQQISQIQTLRDTVSRQQKANEQYAGRQATQTQQQDVTTQQATIATDQTEIQTAIAAAQQIDQEGAGNNPVTQTSVALAPQVPPGTLPNPYALDATVAPL